MTFYESAISIHKFGVNEAQLFDGSSRDVVEKLSHIKVNLLNKIFVKLYIY